MSSRRPGVFTTVGLGTVADLRIEGGEISLKAKDDIVEIMQVAGLTPQHESHRRVAGDPPGGEEEANPLSKLF